MLHAVRRTAVAAATLVALVAMVVAPGTTAGAQDGDTTTTTPTTTSTTTTTLPPMTVPPTTVAPAPTEPPPPPPPQDAPPPPPPEPDPADPTGFEELPPEEVPLSDAAVPPAEVPPGAYAQDASRVIQRQLSVARVEARELQTAYDVARDEVISLQTRLTWLEHGIAGLAQEDRVAIRQVEAARRQFEGRAADAITRGDPALLRLAAGHDDPNQLLMADVLLGAVLDADEAALSEYLTARAAIDEELLRIAERLVDTRLALEEAREAFFEARRLNVAAQFDLAVLAAGSDIVIRGFVFPVAEPYSFGDSFGAPRMMGTEYEHAHQGTDIMAPTGTPLYACERGIVTRMGSDVLGGTKLWVKGESGTYYYYAHLSGFAEGMHDGRVVEAGEVVGFVGDTGNARGGPPHLHFQVHPGGGAAVNPYPLLKVVSDMTRDIAARSR
jgi:murein DD-endopeptidase MepM/ murein hydrolase activator NlpD